MDNAEFLDSKNMLKGSVNLAAFTDVGTFFFQAFSPAQLPCLSYLNLRGNPLDETSAGDLLHLLRNFPSLQSLEVILLGIIFSSIGVPSLTIKFRIIRM